MAPQVRTVTIEYKVFEVLDVQPGHWCPRCLLPSAARLTLATQAVVGGIEGPLKLTTGLRCADGHGWIS